MSIALVAAIALGLSSCASTPTSTDEAEPETSEVADELQVVTTFLPMTQFTQAVTGDRAEVIQLLPTNVGPHDYQAKPTDAQAIANADVLVKNGLELEFFLDDLIENAGNPDLVIIDSSEGIATLSSEETDHGHEHTEDEAHADHDHAEEAHAEEEGSDHDTAEADQHHHGEADPHIWLDPKRAIEQVENIRDGLIALDPDGEAEYTANAAAYIERLQTLDDEITERLAPYAGQTFISFHDYAFYFADSYGLQVEFLVDVPEANPSPDDVRRIMETTEAANIKALLTEPQVGDDAFASLAKDLNINVSAFDPMETGDSAATEPDYYFNVMRQNVDSLEEAFGGSVQSWRTPQRSRPIAAFFLESMTR